MNAAATPSTARILPPGIAPLITGGLTALGLAGAIYATVAGLLPAMAGRANLSMIAWLAASTVVTFVVTPRNFTVGYLVGLLCMLAGWRVGGYFNVAVVWVPLLAAFGAFLLQFLDCMRKDRASAQPAMPAADWHLTFVRIYIGFDMVPHFTEKLFAGAGPFMGDVKAFAAMGLPLPELFVVVGGFCELGIAIGIGLGLFTRLAALGATLYFMIATVLGGHFANGFIWASPNGGWEYPVLMMVLYMGFAWRGAGKFSLDGAMLDAGRMPASLRWLSVRGGQHAR